MASTAVVRDPAIQVRLDDLLDQRGLEAIWFARPNNFAWLTGGDNVVDRASEVGVAAAGYDGDGLTVVTDTIEAPRLRDEELPDAATVETFEWYDGSLAETVAEVSDRPAAADFDAPGLATLDVSTLRQPLTSPQMEAYRALGRDTAAAVEAICRTVSPTDTEREIAARLRGRLATKGIEAPVALVGGGDRAQRYRHLTPTDTSIDDYALVSVTAERDGLFASCTRTVAFDPPGWLSRRHHAAATVEASAIAATREVGLDEGTAGDVFEKIQEAYGTVGWDDEWQSHHQGGAAGFSGREWIATPTHEATVELPMAFAYNPTIRGAKSEDTVLVTENGFEILTDTGEWPTLTAEADNGDVTLSRPDVLLR
ncbi:M24 family metallopeptidase [Haloarculaceae archaeon H-GB1-1]|nr:M24 family metallopeptidase [Haloarculaceae archaeon H-GB1-1]